MVSCTLINLPIHRRTPSEADAFLIVKAGIDIAAVVGALGSISCVCTCYSVLCVIFACRCRLANTSNAYVVLYFHQVACHRSVWY
jgi:hypothetical protein